MSQALSRHAADSHDLIRVQGARVNNLKDVSVEITKRRLTVFTGVGTATDANAMLRVLFSRLGKPHIGSSNAYSFNIPSVKAVGSITVDKANAKAEKVTYNVTGGMCPRCEGMGSVTDIDLTEIYDDSKSLHEGALKVPGYSSDGWHIRAYAHRQTPGSLRRLERWHDLLVGLPGSDDDIVVHSRKSGGRVCRNCDPVRAASWQKTLRLQAEAHVFGMIPGHGPAARLLRWKSAGGC